MKNIDKISSLLLEHVSADDDRLCIVETFLKFFYNENKLVHFPEHSCELSANFLSDLESEHDNIIVCQTEEPFDDISGTEILKNILKAQENLNRNIKLITNSTKCARECKIHIDCIYRPGILDLICHTDFLVRKNLMLNSIKFHTAFVYQNFNAARDETIQYINKHQLIDQFAFVKYLDCDPTIKNMPLPKNDQYKSANDGFFPDAPYDSELDLEWAEHIGFFTEVESFNETDYAPTLSEKTFRAMHLMRPALIFGGLNTRQRLQDLGFDTWDWLINWDFDKEPDWCLRSDLFLEELHRLLNLDLNYIKHLLNKHKDKLIHNRNRVLDLIENYTDDSYFAAATEHRQ